MSQKYFSKIDFAMLVVLLIVSLALAAQAFSFGGVDFGVYYAAGRVVLRGGNPYDFQQLAGEIVSSTGELNNPYYYAPWFTWSILPFSILPYAVARIAWAVANFLLWFWGLFKLNKVIAWPPKGWRRWGVYILATFLFAWTTWGFEQVGVLIFFLFTTLLLAIKNDRWDSAGIWLALLLFKPNITAIPVMAITFWFLLRGKRRPVIVMFGVVAAMVLVSLILSPGWYLALLQPDKLIGLSYTLDSSGSVEIVRYNTTLLDWLSAYGMNGTASNMIYSAVILMGIFAAAWVVRKSESIVEVAAVIILVNFAVIPYALFYDYPALVITLFFVNTLFVSTKPSLIWAGRIMNGFVLLNLFVGATISFRYWMVIVLALFVLLGYYVNSRNLVGGQRVGQAGGTAS